MDFINDDILQKKGSRYVEVSQKDFEELLTKQGYSWKISDERFAKENVYIIENKGIFVKVFSSIVGGISREVGSDAIRVVGWDPVSNLPVNSSEARVYRTENWRQNLINRIETAKEKMQNIEKCKLCGGVMVERENKQKKTKFMGCLNYRNHQKVEKQEYTINKDSRDDSINKDKSNDNHRLVNNIGVRSIERSLGIDSQEKKIPNYDGLKFFPVKGDEPLLDTSLFTWGKFSFEKFNPIQTKVVEVVPGDNNIVVEAKTSTGKTQMGEAAMWKVLNEGKTVIYTSPLKALTREKWDSWIKKFGDSGYKLAIVTGDYRLTDKRIKELNDANIILCTSEMLDHRTRNIASEKSEWLTKAGLLIVDEVQLIGMKERGDKLEAGLMRFTLINPTCRLMLLSGTMPNSGEIAKWIKSLNNKETILIKSDWRPIKLNKKYLPYRDGQGYYASKDNLYNQIIEEVNTYKKEKILIFVHSKTDGKRIMGLLEAKGYAVEFHNADLEVDDRVNIEESFKSRAEGSVRIIIATSTLAYGLNLPARIVIIAGMHRGLDEVWGLDVIQMAGRSGRMGIDTEGDAIIILPESQFDYLKNKIENPEDIISQIDNPMIAGFHIIGEIVNRQIKTRDDVYKWYSRTLASRQNMNIDKDYVDTLVDYLLKNNAIRETEMGGIKRLIETELGKASVYFYLRPDMLKDMMDNFEKVFEKKIENNDFLITLALAKIRMFEDVIVSKDDKAYIGNYHNATKAVESIFGPCVEGQSKIGMAYLNMLKGTKGAEVKEGKKVTNPLVSLQRGLQQDVERICQAIMYIDAKYARWGKVNFLNVIGIRMRYGIGPELVSLCRLDGIGGSYARKLFDAGIKQPLDLIMKKPEAIAALGVRYFGIVDKNKEMFKMLGYELDSQANIIKSTPITESNRALVAESKSVPVIESKPAPVIENNKSLIAEIKPITIIDSTPTTVIESKTISVGENKPAPVIERKTIPVIESKPAPVIESKPAPVQPISPIMIRFIPPVKKSTINEKNK